MQRSADVLGLPEGKTAFTRSDYQPIRITHACLHYITGATPMSRHRWVSIGFLSAAKGVRVLIWQVILACALLPLHDLAGADQGVAVSRDLRADARAAAQNHQPLLLFFTLEGCPYCERVRREYIGPMSRDPEQAARALIREVPIESTLAGFDGAPRSARDLAAAFKVTLFPTVVLVNAQGLPLAEPLVGFSSADFYGAYLDDRIATAQKKTP